MSQEKNDEKALAVDLGGTRMRVALIDKRGRILKKYAERTKGSQGPQQVMERLAGHLKDVAADVPVGSILGLGVGVAGPTNSRTGAMFRPPNLPSWHGFSPKAILEGALGLPVVIGNDASLAALGVHRFGAGKGLSNLLYLTISTGVGGGIIIGGKLYEGSRGFAGELGHILIDRNGPACACGSNGCLESLASGTAIAHIAKERLVSEKGSSLLRIAGGDIDKVDAEMVAQAAKSGDDLALGVMNEAAYNLGLGLVVLLNVFDPDMIVLGGGVSQELDMMMPHILEAIRSQAMTQHKDPVPIVQSKLGDDVGLLGAAALVFDKLK